MSKLFKTEGIVLRGWDLGETDRIITFYSKDYGKIKAVAKGVRRTKSRFGSSMELLSYDDLLIYKGRGLDIIQQCSIKESFRKIREDLVKMVYGSYLAELIDAMTGENEQNEWLFRLLLSTLHLFEEYSELAIITRAFELKALTILGYKPNLDNCVNCNKEIEDKRVVFSPSQGGIICDDCHRERGNDEVIISRGALNLMRLLTRINITKAGRVKDSGGFGKETEKALRWYISYYLERQLNSLTLLDSLRDLEKYRASS